MIILTYLNKLITNLQDGNIPDQGRLALSLFILCVILLISFTNILIYFLILLNLENKLVQNKINQWTMLKWIVNIYKKTRIGFLVFEICLSLYIILFIMYYSHKIYTFYLLD
jgi:hypothetical protein